MNIGIVGSGNIGAAAAELFTRAGHEVALSNSRGPESLAAEVERLGERARAETVEGACEFGELVLVATPLKAYPELPADSLDGTIVVDAMNYYPGRDGEIEELESGELGSSELLARHLGSARVIKAFNTLQAERLLDGGKPAGDYGRLAMSVAGDDADAKGHVRDLIDEIGFEPVDTGSLEDGRRMQPGSPVYGVEGTAAELLELLEER